MAFSLVTIGYGSLVGLSLGLTGGGGSILAIPILVYGLHVQINQATIISLLMVATIALFGAGRQTTSRNVDWQAAFLFSLSGMIVSPVAIFFAHGIDSSLRLILFSILMLFVGFKMARNGKQQSLQIKIDDLAPGQKVAQTIKMGLGGAGAGILSGFFGVGGGFIIVPLLIMIFSMPYPKAVGTSLASIFMISLTAATGAFIKGISIDAFLFLPFVGGGLIGMLAGSALVNSIPEKLTKMIFASITITLALFMLIDNLFIHQGGLS